jgi:hypothetical protein
MRNEPSQTTKHPTKGETKNKEEKPNKEGGPNVKPKERNTKWVTKRQSEYYT